MKRINKMDVWLSFYLDRSNPDTFLNKARSAKAAGYRTDDVNRLGEIGYQNSKKLQNRINKWLDEAGLSESALKEKLIELLFAKETKFFQKDGLVTQTVAVENHAIQRQALEMAMKFKGMYKEDNAQRGQVDQEARQQFMKDLFQTISQANGRGLPEPRE